jgi:hypothetical protein
MTEPVAVSLGARPLHPRRGPHNPATATPPRRRGSVRRTTTHDSFRPEGVLGPVTLVARGRDLRTDDRDATVLDAATVVVNIDFVGGRLVTAIRAEPPADGLEALVGVRASSGFRGAVDAALPRERATGSVRYQLLDDIPTAVLVSGMALHDAGVRPAPGAAPVAPTQQHADLCAGWATDATILTEIARTGEVPRVTGPAAPQLERVDDPLAWHELAELTAHATRRRRRIDLWRDGAHVAIDAFFRDSHVNGDGEEMVVHEYGVAATLEPETRRFLSCTATVGALPWMECPGAVASATRLAGAPADGLRAWVRDTFTGPSTCTHLNDTLRALEDVPALLARL